MANTKDFIVKNGLTVGNNITVSGTVDGRDIATDGSKLDGIESGATADQTASEILTLIKTVDGSGSGLDADTLDGITSARIPYALNGVYGTTNTFKTDGGIGANSISRSMFYRDNNDEFGTIGLHAHHSTNANYAWQLASTAYSNASAIQARVLNNGTWSSPVTIWNSGNDGAGSGLDADTLDGLQGSSYSSNNYITDHYTSNNYIQSYVAAQVASVVDSAPAALDTLNELAAALGDDANFSTTVSNQIGIRSTNTYVNSTFSSNNYLQGQLSTKLSSSSYTASDVLTKIKTVDGSGSGLDADLLDGQQATKFVRDAGNGPTDLDDAGMGVWRINTGHTNQPGGSATNYSTLVSFDNVSDTGFQVAVDYNSASMYFRGGNGSVYGGSGSFQSWAKVWNDLNDGSGSGLDADLLDGVQGSSYLRSDTSDTFTGDLTISGALSATTKSFDIKHPSKDGMRLRYGSLEGPENGVYVRGKSKEKIIELPDYWLDLVHEDSITVQLTAIGKPQDLFVEKIEDNKVYVSGENYFFTVTGERKDVERFEVEYNG